MDEISMISGQLAAAVELTMACDAKQDQRNEAYNACEAFKEKSPLCVQCGLYLAERTEYSHVVRHFGLQLLESSVKYKWYTMSQQEKIFIKENAMKLISEGVEGLAESQGMRDALSRVIVEMAKREWPQQWGSLLAELDAASRHGPLQTELVLLVILRLVEDVVVLQTLESSQRRKDLVQALTANMADLFTFLLGLADKHILEYNSSSGLGDKAAAASHARVVQVVLTTLGGFVEWVQMSHIVAQEGRLLRILCLLLNNEPFQEPAAEVLLQILSRKGKTDERKPLLMLFSTDAMRCIFQAADMSVSKNYQFLKQLTRVVAGLGGQLAGLWTPDAPPPNFTMFLEAMVSFAGHPSLTLVQLANTVFHAFIKHPDISKDPVFLSFVPKWVQAAGPKIIKIIYPTSNRSIPNISPNSPEYYAVLDYDSEEAFNGFFHRYRVELLDAFKQAATVAPSCMFEYVTSWLRAQIEREALNPTPPSEYSTTSPIFLHWEALTLALDSVTGKVVGHNDGPTTSAGLAFIDMCLALEPQDPTVLSALLSCLSALFCFLAAAPPPTASAYLPRVLDKIFSSLVFSLAGETKTQRSRGVKNLRRHAASLMVKIAQKYPLVLLPMFDKIHSIVRGLTASPDTLSTMEATTLQEALLLLSNHICDYEKQTRFIGEVVAPVRGVWLGLTETVLRDSAAFMAYVGLDSPPLEPSATDITGQHRSQLQWCLDVIFGMVKRCTWPTDPNVAVQGGFLEDAGGEGVLPRYKNPATPHVLPLLPGLLAMAHCLNSLSTPQALARLSEGYKSAYTMVEVERQNLLGAAGAPGPGTSEEAAPTTPQRRMQQFISNVYETLYHALALSFTSLGAASYSVPGIAPSLTASLFSNLDCMADFRLRLVVRVFLKHYVSSCPPAMYNSALIPVVAHFTPFMYNRLCTRWQQLTEMRENGVIDDENADTEEVVEEVVNRTLTKEYLDVVKVCLYGGDGEARAPSLVEPLSDLGLRLMATEVVCTHLTLLLLKGLSWSDSVVSLKCCHLVGGAVVWLVSGGRVGPELAAHILTSVLFGLQVHGQHDSNLGSLLQLGTLLYNVLRPLSDNVLRVMEQIPNVNMTDLARLDEKMLSEEQKGVKVDKSKKEMFKKVTNPLIGCNVGQLFKKKASIRDLPKLDIPKANKSPPNPFASSENHLLTNLFNS